MNASEYMNMNAIIAKKRDGLRLTKGNRVFHKGVYSGRDSGLSGFRAFDGDVFKWT